MEDMFTVRKRGGGGRGGRERKRRRGGGRRETVREMTTSVCVCVFIENEEVGSRNGGLGRQKK